MSNLLEIKNLSKKYESFLLDNISFSVPQGYIMGFIGPNGAGKTTTIKSVLGMVTCDEGEIFMLDKRISAESEVIKDEIGVVMDLPFYVEDWKVRDVEKALSPFYSRWNSETYDRYLSKFGIGKNKKVKELSRGMKVKLMLAAALSHEARLLILDEPTSGLDPVARDELMDILGGFMEDENNGVLFSTHITSDLEKIADYITFIIGGKMVFTGEKDALLESYVLIKGGLSDLAGEQRKYAVGYRENSVGFEAMVKKENIRHLSKEISVEKISLEELIVFMNREKKLEQ